MKLEDQVCSLELAKQLKELGIEQESVFNWTPNPTDKDWGSPRILQGKGAWPEIHLVSAFTVAELGEMIEEECYSCFSEESWSAGYLPDMEYVHSKIHGEETEANARAKMLIYTTKLKSD